MVPRIPEGNGKKSGGADRHAEEFEHQRAATGRHHGGSRKKGRIFLCADACCYLLRQSDYDNLSTMQMGLESKSIDEMSAYSSTAYYLLAKNQKFELTSFNNAKLVDSFCCALREEDEELREAMNKALVSMDGDGTLARLVKEYIEDVKDGKEPPSVPIDKKDGADTIKVAVTGDLPPIDLVKEDGAPAGFNTAVLAELGRRMGKNMEIVQVETGARATALTSKRVDVVFWATVPVEDLAIRPMDMDRSKGIETTVPYYKDDIVHLKLKNP